MRPPIDDSTILVTGASSGIGMEFARQLAPRAKTLVLVARRVDRLEKLKAELTERRPELGVHLLPCDLADREATDAMVARLDKEVGPVDIVVNNAGLGSIGMFDRTPWPKIAQLLQVNIFALTYLVSKLLPPMIARRRGGILNVSSGFGMEFMPGFAAYVGTKHYVTGFTECLAIEARGSGVVVSQLCPGPVATEFEEVAGNFTGMKVPGFLELTAAECVRWAVRAFAHGRALIVPGVIMNIVQWIGAVTPRWVKRLLYRPFARRMRLLQERSEGASAKAVAGG